VVDRLGSIKHRHGLDFLVASDPGAQLIDAFGIGFAPGEEERERSRSEGHDLAETLGAASWTLPYPTAVVIATDGVATFVDVHPNWMVRTVASTILDEVRKLTQS
jgi:peroxiredoxin